MKKALGVICLLLLVSSASAYIELYLKEGGVNNYIFDPAARNYLPYFDGCSSAEILPGVLVDPNPMTRTFFVWGRFVNEAGTKIFGIMPNVSLAANVQGLNISMGQNVIYRHKKTNGLPGQRWTRWDGTINLGINSPAAAVTANGIVDDGTNAWDLVCAYGSLGEAEFLLGAFELSSPGGPVLGDLTLGLGRLGLAANDGSQSYYPEVRVAGQIVQEFWYEVGQPLPGVPVTHPGPVYLSWIPEPASLLLLSLGLLLRRR